MKLRHGVAALGLAFALVGHHEAVLTSILEGKR